LVKRIAVCAVELRGCCSVHYGLSPTVGFDVTPLRLSTIRKLDQNNSAPGSLDRPF
jgi:hypothetical protein